MDIKADLIAFFKKACSPYHAVQEIASYLEKNGFIRTKESDSAPKDSTPRYFTREGAAILAYIPGTDLSQGFASVMSHTDSPVIRILQSAKLRRHGNTLQIPCEPYGGVMLGRWLDRPLQFAGRVAYLLDGRPHTTLVESGPDACFMPSIAPHMMKEKPDSDWKPSKDEICILLPVDSNNNVTINGTPIDATHAETFSDLLASLIARKTATKGSVVISSLFIDVCGSPSTVNFIGDDIFQAPRQDNLMSLFLSSRAIVHSLKNQPSMGVTRMIAGFDNEEIGSRTYAGAGTPLVYNWYAKLCGGVTEAFLRGMARSIGLSADGAHASHPVLGASSAMEPIPLCGKGFCFKLSQKQNYAFKDTVTATVHACAVEAGTPYQDWVHKAFAPGGSTIGNITVCANNLRMIDSGVPLYAMHSCVETSSLRDAEGYALFMAKMLERSVPILNDEVLSEMAE